MPLISADFLRPYKIFNDWIWFYYSMIGIIPLFVLTLYKYRNQFEMKHYKNKELPRNLLQDKISYLFMIYAWIYYLIDCSFTLLSWSFNDNCRFHLFSHHFICLFALPFVFDLGYYPWFILLMPAYHSLLIFVTDSDILNISYAISILITQYNLLKNPHYNTRKYYSLINKFIFVLYIPLVGMFVHNCRNSLPDYTF